MKSKISFSDFVRTTSRGNLWIPSFVTFGFLLAFPAASILLLGKWQSFEYTPAQIEVLYENLWRDGLAITAGIVTAVTAVLNGIRSFFFLYSKKQTDFYHSLPVKRSRIFWGRVYMSGLYYLIPYLLTEFLAVCVGAAKGFFSLKLMGMALRLAAVHLILYLLLYFSVVLVECVTGSFLTGALCIVGMNVYGTVLSFLLICCGSVFYTTFYNENVYGVFAFLQKYCSPAFLGKSLLEAYRDGQYLPLLPITAAAALIFAVLSYRAYIRRPSEATGKPMIYRSVAVVLKFMVVIPCGLGTGFALYAFSAPNGKIVWWILGLLLGTVLSHGLMEILYQMNFRAFFSRKWELCAAAALAAVCAWVYLADLTGFDRYLPAKDEIRSVEINVATLTGEYGCKIEELENGKFLNVKSGEAFANGAELFSGSGIGEKTYQTLGKIVEHQKERATAADAPEWTSVLNMKYRLKSGREVYRSYYLTSDENRELAKAFYEEENLKDYLHSYQELDQKYLSKLQMLCVDGANYSLFQNDSSRGLEFLGALKEDVQEADAEEMLELPCARLEIMYRLPAQERADRMVPGRKAPTLNASWWVNIYPSYKRTLAILEETGYPLSMDELEIEKVSVVYYDDTGEEFITDYEDPEKVEALKKAMVPAYFTGPWMDVSGEMGVYLFGVKNQPAGAYMCLLNERIPDFINEDFQDIISETEE